MESADEALLPAVYREVGAELHATPAGLGALTLCRSIVQAACYPLAAYAAVAISRGLNGIGLALVVPSIQSLVADSMDEGTRGSAFGWLQLASSLGFISGGFVGLLLAQTKVLGIAGWRVAFHLVAAISVAVGALNWFLAVDPHFPTSESGGRRPVGKQSATAREVVVEMIEDAKFVVRIPTFQIFVAQGVSGSFPWSALSFASMWLELVGFSHGDTAVLMTIFWVASSLGGKMGDVLAVRYPDAGRIVLSQIGAGSAVPLAAVLLRGLPEDPSAGIAYGVVLFVMGVFISWNGPATNLPIIVEIVPEKSRTSILARRDLRVSAIFLRACNRWSPGATRIWVQTGRQGEECSMGSGERRVPSEGVVHIHSYTVHSLHGHILVPVLQLSPGSCKLLLNRSCSRWSTEALVLNKAMEILVAKEL